MALTSWDDATDSYDYQQLANNWQIIDFHDHTPGRGVPVPAGGLGSGAVLSQNIASGAVGIQHLSSAVANSLVSGGVGSFVASTTAATESFTFTFPTAFSTAPNSFVANFIGGAPGTAIVAASEATATNIALTAYWPGGSFTSGNTYDFYWMAAVL